MAVGGAEGRFQFGEVLRFEQVVHPFAHPVAEVGPFGKGLPGPGQVILPDGFHRMVDVTGDVFGEHLHPEAAVEGHREQGSHDAKAGVDAFHASSFLSGRAVRRGSFFSRK